MKQLFILIIIATFIGGAWWLFHDTDKQPQKPDQRREGNVAVKVITQPIEITSNDKTFKAVGTGRAKLSVGIYSSVSEEVTKVTFESQQQVQKDNLLVQLDDREEQLALQLAEVEVKNSKSLLDRYNQAVKQGAVPESEVDSARATYDSAIVALEQAKLAVEDRKIKSPFDGTVGIPQVDAGDRINPDTLITNLDARNILYIDFEIPEALIGNLSAGSQQSITAITPAFAGKEFAGYISAQENRIDPQRRTMMVRALIDNTNDLLRPGMSFETTWNIKGEEYPTVPEISVQWGREGPYIWVIRDNISVQIPVQVVARKTGRVLLNGEDLKSNDKVVIEGLQRLRPNQKVEVLGEANS